MARSANQGQLMLFFVNPPLMALSGGFTPIEAIWWKRSPWLGPLDGRLLDHSATVSACDNMPQCEQ